MKAYYKILLLCFFAIMNMNVLAQRKQNINMTTKIHVDNVPILALKSSNSVAQITLINNNHNEKHILNVSFRLKSSNGLSDFRHVVIKCENKTLYSQELHLTGKKARINCPINTVFQDTIRLEICLTTADNIDLLNRISFSDIRIKTNEGWSIADCSKTPVLRMGIALRQHGQDGVNTTRIPGLTTTTHGTLIAIYDARHEMSRDLQGDIDICYNRSTDGGRTWTPIQTAINMGTWGNLPKRYNGVSDGSVTCDTVTGDLYICGVWMHGVLDSKTGKWIEGLNEKSTIWNHQWLERGSQPGYDVKQSSQFLMVKSTDDGITWSTPFNLTRQLKPKNFWLFAPAPGAGITMKDGTIVIPAQGRNETGQQISTLIYSKDHGNSWIAGNVSTTGTNENMIVQLRDSSLMLNARVFNNRGKESGNGRAVAITKDLGKTWKEHATSHHALIEPACQASLLQHNGILYFFNPNDKHSRIKHTLKVSFDDGNTWPESYWIEMDAKSGAGYSCMTVWNDELCILYEGSGANLVFQKIKLKEILNRSK